MKISDFCKKIRPYFFITEPQGELDRSEEFSRIDMLPNGGNAHNLNLSFVTPQGTISYTFRKSLGFKKEELDIISYIICEINKYISHGYTSEIPFLLDISQTKAISHFLSICNYDINDIYCPLYPGKEGLEKLSRLIISKYFDWAAQTYEGNKISFAVGISFTSEEEINDLNRNVINLEDYLEEDYFKVLTTGKDTFLHCDENGNIISHKEINSQGQDGTINEGLYAPVQFEYLCNWTNNNRIIFLLNRNGEILIFYRKSLYFLRRRNEWKYLPHKQLMMKAYPYSTYEEAALLGKAIYDSTLDISFRKTGGCIGIVQSAPHCLDESNSLCNISSDKQKLYRRLIGEKKFHELPRKLRMELLSLDGATLLKRDGTIVAVGSILNLSSSHQNAIHGGREAAAINISKNGNIGIKISNDGKVSVYQGGNKSIEYL